MVYRDLPGNPGFLPHRINDISLKVTSPIGTVYYGNNGLTAGNVSTPGGSANTVDTKENVWIADAARRHLDGPGPRRGHQHRPLPGDRRQQRRLLAVDHRRHRGLHVEPGQLLHPRDHDLRLPAIMSASGSASATAPFGLRPDRHRRRGQQPGPVLLGRERPPGDPLGQQLELQLRPPARLARRRAPGQGIDGLCNGNYSQDLNAAWTAQPSKNPGAGATVQAQFWFRDPASTSNQTTALSDALEFGVCPVIGARLEGSLRSSANLSRVPSRG